MVNESTSFHQRLFVVADQRSVRGLKYFRKRKRVQYFYFIL